MDFHAAQCAIEKDIDEMPWIQGWEQSVYHINPWTESFEQSSSMLNQTSPLVYG